MIPCFPPVGLGEAPATPQHGSNGLGQPIFWGFGELGNVAAARVVQERIRTNGWVAATCGIAKESLKTIRGIIAGSGVTRQRTTPSRPSGFLRGMSTGTIYNCDQSGVLLRWAIIEDKA
jgi:hypothetical protein